MINNIPRTVLINAFMKRITRVMDGHWTIEALGGQFGSISKNNGKYFAHYTNRRTALRGHKYFMQAVVECMNGYIEFMLNYEAQFKHQPVFHCEGNFHVVFGTDKRMYVKHTSDIEYRAISHVDIYNFATEIRRNFPHHNETGETMLAFTKNLFIKVRERG